MSTFPNQGKRQRWPFRDPALAMRMIEERLMAVFRRVRDELKTKIEE